MGFYFVVRECQGPDTWVPLSGSRITLSLKVLAFSLIAAQQGLTASFFTNLADAHAWREQGWGAQLSFWGLSHKNRDYVLGSQCPSATEGR